MYGSYEKNKLYFWNWRRFFTFYDFKNVFLKNRSFQNTKFKIDTLAEHCCLIIFDDTVTEFSVARLVDFARGRHFENFSQNIQCNKNRTNNTGHSLKPASPLLASSCLSKSFECGKENKNYCTLKMRRRIGL